MNKNSGMLCINLYPILVEVYSLFLHFSVGVCADGKFVMHVSN